MGERQGWLLVQVGIQEPADYIGFENYLKTNLCI
eukprot:SAG22_NODE_23920_length_127_cov_863.607143_1_plen_33_part_10